MENRFYIAHEKVSRVLALVLTFLKMNGTFSEQRPLWPGVVTARSARVAQRVMSVTKQ